MALAVTIGGASKRFQIGSLSSRAAINQRTVTSAVVRSLDGSYIPATRDEVVIADAPFGVGGYIDEAEVEPSQNAAGGASVDTGLTISDYDSLLARQYIDESAPSETLKARITRWVSTYYTEYGVTLDAGQVDGPTLAARVYANMRGDAAFDELVKLTSGYFRQIDVSKVLSMAAPGSVAAPFGLSRGDTRLLGLPRFKRARTSTVNKVILIAGTATLVQKTDTFVGDGSTDTFVLTYPLNAAGVPQKGEIKVNGVLELLVFSPGSYWSYDAGTNSITRDAGAPGLGDTITITYDALFPITVVVQDAADILANGTTAKRIEAPDVFDITNATQIAQDALDVGLAESVTGSIPVDGGSLAPGQVITLDFPELGVSNEDCLITEVITSMRGVTRLQQQIEVAVGERAVSQWQDYWKESSGGSAESVASGSTGSATSTPWFSELSLGGNRNAGLVTDPVTSTIRPYNWREPEVPWGDGIVAEAVVEIECWTPTGSVQPKVYDGSGTLVATGSAETSSTPNPQTIVIPPAAVNTKYHIRFTLVTATINQARCSDGAIKLKRAA